MDYLELSKALNAFGKYVIQQSRSNLTKGKPPYGDKNDTGALYNSLKYEPRQEEGAFLIDFIMEDYENTEKFRFSFKMTRFEMSSRTCSS